VNTFSDWLKKRHLIEDNNDLNNPVRSFDFNRSDLDYADDQGKVEEELFKIVFRKYPEETIDFLTSISQRGDNEVRALLNKIDKKAVRLGKKPEHPSDKEEVVPSSADSGYGDINQ
jgi:hypothetical protein